MHCLGIWWDVFFFLQNSHSHDLFACWTHRFLFTLFVRKAHCVGNSERSPPLHIILWGPWTTAFSFSSISVHHKQYEQRQCDPTCYFLEKYIPERRAHKEVIYSARLSWTYWCLPDPSSDSLSPISLPLSPFHSHSFSHSVSISFDSCHVWALTPSYMRTAGEKLKPPFSDAVICSHECWKYSKTTYLSCRLRCRWWNSNGGADDFSSRFNLVTFTGYVVEIT